jgi:hypothetical protein
VDYGWRANARDFDAGGIGLVLIGMPGIEKRLARYPQFYSRIGFVHEFRTLSAQQVRELLAQRWRPAGVALPDSLELDPESVAAIIRVAGGNFRLLGRLLTQAERILEINGLTRVNTSVIDAARESLVIGQLYSFNSGSFLKVTSCRKNSKFCEAVPDACSARVAWFRKSVLLN